MDDSRIKSASALLSAYFDEEKLKQGGRYAEFFACWKELVGAKLAAHSRVADLDKGVLVIEAEHPGWIQLLQLRQGLILESLASRFPEFELRSIVFRLGRARPGESPAEPGAGAREAPGPFGPKGRALEPETARIDEGPGQEEGPPEPTYPRKLEEIGDSELRELLAGLKRSIEGGKG